MMVMMMMPVTTMLMIMQQPDYIYQVTLISQNNKLQLLFTVLLPYVPAANRLLECHINAICAKYFTFINGEVCQNIYQKQTHWHQLCDQEYSTPMTMMKMQPESISRVYQYAKSAKNQNEALHTKNTANTNKIYHQK